MEIASPCDRAPARRDTYAGIAAACCALAIEEEIEGQAIRRSFEAHGSGELTSTVHNAPPSREAGRVGQPGSGSDGEAESNASAKRRFRSEALDWHPIGAAQEAIGETGAMRFGGLNGKVGVPP
jgi:hypothetical protein